jgi:hypothetical protein
MQFDFGKTLISVARLHAAYGFVLFQITITDSVNKSRFINITEPYERIFPNVVIIGTYLRNPGLPTFLIS